MELSRATHEMMVEILTGPEWIYETHLDDFACPWCDGRKGKHEIDCELEMVLNVVAPDR